MANCNYYIIRLCCAGVDRLPPEDLKVGPLEKRLDPVGVGTNEEKISKKR